MLLKREKLSDAGDNYRGEKWCYTIRDNNPDLLELAEDLLRLEKTGFVLNDGIYETWDKYCDLCPCYEDGFSSGFYIPIDEIENFKKSWNKVKKEIRNKK